MESRKKCNLWNAFENNQQDFENIKCWILRSVHEAGNDITDDKCLNCSYYKAINSETDTASDLKANSAYIVCNGKLSNERSSALTKAWEFLKKRRKNVVILDMSNCNNVYSSGLGTIIRIHKETQNSGGILVIICPDGYIKNLFHVTRVSRILNIVKNQQEARVTVDAHKKHTETASCNSNTLCETKSSRSIPACFEYWTNKNPQNSNNCDVCLRKRIFSKHPCWIVDDVIEGVSFQYVNDPAKPATISRTTEKTYKDYSE
jgi:anti-sigma B factor antagonist